MNENEQLINRFYTAFQNKDYKGMQACYSDQASFSDAVFKNLDSAKVKAMWQMLLSSGSDLRLEFKNVIASGNTGSADWVAYYTFSRTGKKVINRIHADFEFKDGKIIKHTDHFNFYKWASQALGITGMLLGFTPMLKNKTRGVAARNLEQFMKKTGA